ncbi:hypothetical protein [Candidatus Binatus sp.]|uniref:hypothetical protein n=1 Tax=Candidatus Binatus sp. TaxID=2811406 RepID=UPI002F949CAF
MKLRPKAADRAMALDTWNFVGRVLMSQSPWIAAPVFTMLYDYMRACGAPLPETYAGARVARMRINRGLRQAYNPRSGISGGWRQHWLGAYPLSDLLVRRYGFPKVAQAQGTNRKYQRGSGRQKI